MTAPSLQDRFSDQELQQGPEETSASIQTFEVAWQAALERNLGQCREWECAAGEVFRKCELFATINSVFAATTSVVIIILNVVIAAYEDLQSSWISCFVILNSVVKGVQLHFQFALKSDQLHEVKHDARRLTMKLQAERLELRKLAERKDGEEAMDRKIEGLREGVIGLTAKLPTYINWNPATKEAQKRRGGGHDTEQGGVEQEAEKRPSGGHDTEQGVVDRKMLPDPSHGVPPPTKLGGAWSSLIYDQAEARVLEDLEMALDTVIKQLAMKRSVFQKLHFIQTAVELILNMLITLSETVPQLKEVAPLTPICAAANAFLKGIDMKVQPEATIDKCQVLLAELDKQLRKVCDAQLRQPPTLEDSDRRDAHTVLEKATTQMRIAVPSRAIRKRKLQLQKTAERAAQQPLQNPTAVLPVDIESPR